MGKKQKIVLPPELPPEVPEDEIEISDEDLDFVSQNRDYAGFVSSLDTQSINKHVTRVADMKEDALETLYERRLKRKLVEKEIKQQSLEVDPVDALPFKTLDGRLYYRTGAPEMDKVGDDKYKSTDESITKLTKADKRAKLKKSRKEAKKQKKEQGKKDEIHQTPQAAVLDEVKKDLTAEEVFGSKKRKLAELGMALLADPESNIKFLKEMLQMSKDDDLAIAKLGMLSLLAVFRDVIPGYRIRLPTEKELEMKVSKAVKKMRYYESTLLSSYKAYLQRLIALEKQPTFHHLAVQCLCTLLDAVPHFNFRDSLLAAVTKNISSPDDVVRKLCCNTIASLFSNESKHGGQATVEAVRLIANHVKLNDCQLHPDSIEVFMNLSFDEDLGKHESLDGEDKLKNKKNRKRRNREQLNELQGNQRKKTRQQLIAKTREEVNADYKAASFVPDKMEKRKMQSETLSSLFQTYFRILKHSLQTNIIRSETKADKSFSAFGTRPLLDPCLNGLGKFSQLIDLDFIGDLMNYLKRLATSGSCSQGTISGSSSLTVSERLRCCIVAFKVMKSNLDALKVDLQDFFVQLYNLILEYRPGRDQGEVLAEALKIMLCEDRQHDMQKAAAFIKRLATFSLCFGSPESMAALVTLKHLLQKNVKCRNLLENDAGGGSVAGSMAKYQPFASDPNQSGALASVLWELNLLSKHYHPAVSAMASSIGNMNTAPNKAHLSTMSPQQAYKELFLEWESSKPKGDIGKLNCKRRGGGSSVPTTATKPTLEEMGPSEDEARKELMKHFVTLHDFKENERLRGELDRTALFLELYEEYKKRKKSKSEGLKALKKKAKISSMKVQ